MSSLFFIYFAVCISVASSFSISCGSQFTADGTSFCVGLPVECSVSLNPDLCIEGEDNITESNLEVSIHSNDGSVQPQFEFVQQAASLLTVIVDYVPEFNLETITVQVFATVSSMCIFDVSHTSVVRSSSSECLFPLDIVVNHNPAVVKGGDLIELELELTAASTTARKLSFSLYDFHPALALAGSEFASNGNIASTGTADNNLLLENLRLARDSILFANITFRVQPYVQPMARLYFSFQVSYRSTGYGLVTFVQGLKFFDEYIADKITHGNWSFSLMSYEDMDRVDFAFPPHVDDIFSIDIPFTVPCVSAELSMSFKFPSFRSDNFTSFLTSITNVSTTLPPNLVRIATLCQYRDPGFNRRFCEIGNLQVAQDPPIVTMAAVGGPGINNIHVNLGPILYTFATPDCATNSSAANCTCAEEDIIVTLTGHVVNDSIFCENEPRMYPLLEQSSCGIFCENQTLADNVTVQYTYTREATVETTPLQFDTNPSITQTTASEDDVFPVNASMPAISVTINSFTGDAGDSYNLTFGVLHISEYSSFTAYDLNYTFSVEPHLEPDENITICFFNVSKEPTVCEEVPFLNYTITRSGYHPE